MNKRHADDFLVEIEALICLIERLRLRMQQKNCNAWTNVDNAACFLQKVVDKLKS